ncbi:MAG: response regulator [Oligoflexia bacterium]|nr:response regulator [Oligoflexia bacterium]
MNRVMIVEDEAVTALDVEDTLTHLGYQVVGSVATGEEAVGLAKSEKPDIVLMDIVLKGAMDGITAAQEIWETLEVPIVFLTAYSDEATLGRAKCAKPYGYILKPFDERHLQTALQIALNRRASDKEATDSRIERQTEARRPKFEAFDEVQFGKGKLTPAEFVHRVDPFRTLPEAELTALVQGAVFKSYDAGALVASEGDHTSECIIPARGRFVLVKGSTSGKELAIGLLPPGDIYALIVALQDAPLPFTIRAQRASSALALDTKTVRSMLETRKELYEDFGITMAEKLRAMEDLSRLLAHERVEVRIATALLSVVRDFGLLKDEGTSYVVEMTRQELADLVGTTAETAIRVTRALEDDEILDLTTPARIRIINMQGLEALAVQ